MAGAIAGSVILDVRQQSDRLRLITLSVNNSCNLRCPHCYLQLSEPDSFIAESVIQQVLCSDCERIAIVGKEPLVTAMVARKTCELARRATASGKRVSLITNGLGLDYLPEDIGPTLDFIDVSFDGGPATYQSYRGPSYDKLVSRIWRRTSQGFCRFRALACLSSATAHAIEDTLAVAEIEGIEFLMLSPYLPTMNHGTNTVAPVSLSRLLIQLAESNRFRDTRNVILLIALHELKLLREDESSICALIDKLALGDKTVLIDCDPLDLGIVRVSYDGRVLTPLESLHPAYYTRTGISLSGTTVNEAFSKMRTGASAACHYAN